VLAVKSSSVGDKGLSGELGELQFEAITLESSDYDQKRATFILETLDMVPSSEEQYIKGAEPVLCGRDPEKKDPRCTAVDCALTGRKTVDGKLVGSNYYRSGGIYPNTCKNGVPPSASCGLLSLPPPFFPTCVAAPAEGPSQTDARACVCVCVCPSTNTTIQTHGGWVRRSKRTRLGRYSPILNHALSCHLPCNLNHAIPCNERYVQGVNETAGRCVKER